MIKYIILYDNNNFNIKKYFNVLDKKKKKKKRSIDQRGRGATEIVGSFVFSV